MELRKFLNFAVAAIIILVTVFLVFSGTVFSLSSFQPAKDQLISIQPGQTLYQELSDVPQGFNSITFHYASLKRITPWQKLPFSIELSRHTNDQFISIPLIIQRQSLPLGKLIIRFPAQNDGTFASYQIKITNVSADSSFSIWSGSIFAPISMPPAVLDQTIQSGFLSLHIGVSILSASAYNELALIFARAGLCFLLTLVIALLGLPLFSFLNLDQTTENHFFYSLGLGVVAWTTLVWGFSRFSILPGTSLSWLLLITFASLVVAVFLLRSKKGGARISPNWKKLAWLGVGFGLVLVVRAFQFKDLFVPPWVDGLNHYEKVERLLQQGALPPGDIYPIAYHLLSAYLQRSFDIGIPEAMLVAGLWISTFSSLAIYPLAERILKNQTAGWLAVILYSFFTPFPAYLATWSRFPFLFALGLLALACTATLEWLHAPKRIPWLVGVYLSGIALTHYGTLIHWAAFTLCAVLFTLLPFKKKSFAQIAGWKTKILVTLLPAVIILAFQITSLARQGIIRFVLDQHAIAAESMDYAYTFWLTFQHAGGWIWGFGLLSIFTLFTKRSRLLIILPGWMAALAGLNILQQLMLNSVISSWMNFIINLSMPLAILASWGLQEILAGTYLNRLKTAKILFLAFLILAGISSQANIINPDTFLLTRSDLDAMHWIKANTPVDAVFAVKSFSWSQTRVPADAGGWIPALTGRKSVWPVNGNGQADPLDALRQSSSRYIYFSQGRGDFSSEQISVLRPLTKVVYNRNGVQIWLVLD
jgi:hypothetical protein